MNDVIGVRVLGPNGKWVGFLTYGRLWDPSNDAEFMAAIEAALPTFGIESVEEIHLCNYLNELASCPYFYEGLVWFAMRPIPYGDQYEAWRQETRSELENGQSIYLVGELK